MMILVGAIAAFVLLSAWAGPPVEPGRSRRTPYVFALEDDGRVRRYLIERGDGRPRLVPVGPAVRYEPGDRR
jgi:hypothetical protein